MCATANIQSKSILGKVLHENQSNIHFDPQLFDFWVVMNTINGIARGDYSSHQVWPQRSECWVKGAPANMACAERTQNVYCWEKNSELKGITY